MPYSLIGLRAALVAALAIPMARAQELSEAEANQAMAATRSGGATEVVAHRGASAYAPENTLAAFRLAIDMGAQWFELDTHLSSDGIPVVIHDDSLDRTTDRAGGVQTLTVSQIREADAGVRRDPKFAGERVPRLTEALGVARGKAGVYLEIKSATGGDLAGRAPLDAVQAVLEAYPELSRLEDGPFRTVCEREARLVQAVIRDIRDCDAVQSVLIQSFSPIVCAIARREAPETAVALLGGGLEEDAAWEAYVATGRAMGVDSLSADLGSISEGRIRGLHEEGLAVAVYTVNDEPQMTQLVEWGADRIITDRPDLCLTVTRVNAERS